MVITFRQGWKESINRSECKETRCGRGEKRVILWDWAGSGGYKFQLSTNFPNSNFPSAALPKEFLRDENPLVFVISRSYMHLPRPIWYNIAYRA